MQLLSLGHYWAYVRKSHACLLTTPSTTVTPSTTATPSTTVTPSSVTTPTREKDEPLANTGQYDTMDNSPRSDNDEKISQQAPTDGMEMEGGAIGVQSDVSTTTGVQSDESTTTGAQSVVGDVVQSDETLSVGVQSDEDVWLKFNDVSVTEVSWADVQKESYGGSHNTSAYCLIYVNKELHQQFTRRGVSSLEDLWVSFCFIARVDKIFSKYVYIVQSRTIVVRDILVRSKKLCDSNFAPVCVSYNYTHFIAVVKILNLCGSNYLSIFFVPSSLELVGEG